LPMDRAMSTGRWPAGPCSRDLSRSRRMRWTVTGPTGRDPARVAAMCNDYRAGAGIDRGLTRPTGTGRRIAAPLHFVWSENGVSRPQRRSAGRLEGLGADVSGAEIPGIGHFAMDEAPEAVLAEFLGHFAALRPRQGRRMRPSGCPKVPQRRPPRGRAPARPRRRGSAHRSAGWSRPCHRENRRHPLSDPPLDLGVVDEFDLIGLAVEIVDPPQKAALRSGGAGKDILRPVRTGGGVPREAVALRPIRFAAGLRPRWTLSCRSLGWPGRRPGPGSDRCRRSRSATPDMTMSTWSAVSPPRLPRRRRRRRSPRTTASPGEVSRSIEMSGTMSSVPSKSRIRRSVVALEVGHEGMSGPPEKGVVSVMSCRSASPPPVACSGASGGETPSSSSEALSSAAKMLS
jgi:hypothetical protein